MPACSIVLFGFNIYGMGFALAAFFANLILTSWSVGIVVSGVLLRNGMGAESLAWTLMFVLMPLTCVYYPVATLPDSVPAETYISGGCGLITAVHAIDRAAIAVAQDHAVDAGRIDGVAALRVAWRRRRPERPRLERFVRIRRRWRRRW